MINFFHMSSISKYSLIILLMFSSAGALFAQSTDEEDSPDFGDTGPPPDFTPPPPPDFEPGSPPPDPPGQNAQGQQNQDQQQQPQQGQQQQGQQQPDLDSDSKLVDRKDPAMQETVGMIRIPDMGTNEVLEMLETFTAKPILRQQSLPSVKITFFSQGPLTRGEAIIAIESLLALNGIAITELGDQFLKAVPNATINAQGAKRWEGTTLDATPTQQIYEKLFKLDFLSVEEAVQNIQPLMSQGAPIAFNKSNFLLITDALVNLQRIERILKMIDQPANLNKKIMFFQLQNIDAQDVLQRLEQIMEGPLSQQLQGNTAFDADERTNQLLVFTHPRNEDLVNDLIDKLDIDIAPLTTTKVYNIRYADSTEVVEIIEQVVSGQREVRRDQGDDNSAASARRSQQRREQNQAAAAARSEATNLQFSDFLTIVPDERANTIVASGTQNDIDYLGRLIEEIDTLLAQVRIEVVITEVRLSENDTRGIDSLNFRYNVLNPSETSENNEDEDSDPGFGDNSDQKFASTSDFYGASIPGVTWGPDGFGIEFALNAINSNSNAKILSAPTIVTTHNKEAVVSVGEERPVLVSQVSDSGTGTSGVVTRDQIQFKDIKLELKVTPLIGSDGVVQLEIDQQVQSVVGREEIGDRSQPIIGSRQATSYVSVRDGEMIVLGGLQSLDITESGARMAILGKIPLLGELFTSDSEDFTKTELLIFIRPTIIRTTQEADEDAKELMGTIEGGDRVEEYFENSRFKSLEERRLEEKEEEEDEEKPTPRRRRQP